jgi:hypothetical protein
MDPIVYWIGVLLAVLGGASHYLGLILEKYVINRLPKEAKLMKSLIKEPLWLVALSIRFGLGSIFFVFAQIIIGPAITPGLMASGLIILAFGSIWILGEQLNVKEIISIIVIILGVLLIGLSGFSIEITEENLLDVWFLIRMFISTSVLILVSFIFYFISQKFSTLKALLLALTSGIMLSLNNFWIAPLLWSFVNLFNIPFNFGALILCVISLGFLFAANVLAVITMSRAFKVGKASYLAPIQNIPVQLTPSILYFLVFLMMPPNAFSIVLLTAGILLIIVSSFILGKRQAELENIM